MVQTAFVPPHDDFREHTRANYSWQGVGGYIGAEMTRVDPGYCEIEVRYRPELTQQDGYFHAGITATIGDSAGGYAAYTLFERPCRVLTVEYKINLLEPADGELLRACGAVIRLGRKITACRVDIYSIRGESQTLCATMLQTVVRVSRQVEPR